MPPCVRRYTSSETVSVFHWLKFRAGGEHQEISMQITPLQNQRQFSAQKVQRRVSDPQKGNNSSPSDRPRRDLSDHIIHSLLKIFRWFSVASSIKSQLRGLAAYRLTLSHTPSSSCSWCLCSGEPNCYLPFPAQHQGFHSLCPSVWNALPSQLPCLQVGATSPLKPAQTSPSQKKSLRLLNSLLADLSVSPDAAFLL